MADFFISQSGQPAEFNRGQINATTASSVASLSSSSSLAAHHHLSGPIHVDISPLRSVISIFLETIVIC